MIKTAYGILSGVFVLIFISGCDKINIREGLGGGPMADGDYYVATWGNDTLPGTFEQPWATWQKAFSTAEPGDIVYFRGGIYYADGGAVIDPYRWPAGDWGHSGTEGNWIHYLNYPGETPVLDLSKYNPEGTWNVGIGLNYITYVHFRGLTVRNVFQFREGVTARGIEAYACSNLTFENMTVHNVSGRSIGFFGGFGSSGIDPKIPNVPYDTVRYINCDSYNSCDSLCINLANCELSSRGGIADGFKFNNAIGSYVSFEGCRAWNNSDDGFDLNGSAVIKVTSCWSFNNGRLEGDGYGYKMAGPEVEQVVGLCRIFTNNLSAFNKSTGLGLNLGTGRYTYYSHWFNNTIYKNFYGITQSKDFKGDTLDVIFRNNILFDNTFYNFDNIGVYIAELNNFNNKWPFDYRIPTSADDFESLIPYDLTGPRKPDGSLPDVKFLKLAKGSDLVGLGYSE